MAKLYLQGEEERSAGIYYEIELTDPPLGIGGMGRVMPGKRVDIQTHNSTPVAVKCLYSNLPERAIEHARLESSIRIKSECLVEMLGFVRLEWDDDLGNPCIFNHVISELLQGVALKSFLEGNLTDQYGQRVTYAECMYKLYLQDRVNVALKIVKQVLTGLMALHDAGYIHRDIDPSNIMLTKDQKIKVIDFGIIKNVSHAKNAYKEEDKPKSTAFVGKLAYAAPELVLGDQASQNFSTDLYAVGVLLFELITGRRPFVGDDETVRKKQLSEPLPTDMLPAVYALRSVLIKATEKQQIKRYQTAAEFRADIEKLEQIWAITPIEERISNIQGKKSIWERIKGNFNL